MTADAPTIASLQAEIAALQQHQTLLEQALQAAEQRTRLHEELFEQLPISIAIWRLDQPDDPRSIQLVAANAHNQQVAGFDLRSQIGRRLVEIFPAIPEPLLQVYADVVRSGTPRDLGEITAPDEDKLIGGVTMSIQAIPLPDRHLCLMVENITERRRAEAALRQAIAQEEKIRVQEAMLSELSTPLIPISDQVVVMPLIGTVDSRRAQQVMATLLHGIAESHASIAILDITGVTLVDTQVANALIHAAQAVRLLGAQVVLTGIRPEVAQTLVGLGADLSSIITHGNLQSGISYATSQGE